MRRVASNHAIFSDLLNSQPSESHVRAKYVLFLDIPISIEDRLSPISSFRNRTKRTEKGRG